MEGIIILLGSPNDEEGQLSSIGIERANCSIEEYRKHPDYKILPTGGFGEHFNKTDMPHAYYAKHYLITQGIPEKDVLEFANSTNTFEDASSSKLIVDRCQNHKIIIVTSDFHIERARMIFENSFIGYDLKFSGATTHLPKEQIGKLIRHEKKAIRSYALTNNG